MASPLAGGLAKTIAGAFKSLFFDAVLSRNVILPTIPAYDPADPPAATLVAFPCKAMADTYSSYDRANSNIGTSDVKILILAKTLGTIPTENDVITLQGSKFSVIKSDIDPANAVWVCQASK